MHERHLDTGTVVLNYAEGPASGPAFVLLHGGAASWQYGAALLDDLRHRWQVYAPDLRGHGKSSHVPKRYKLHDYTDDIGRFLHDAVQRPACLYGHSLGGQIALCVAAQYPDLVRAVIVGDAPPFSKDQPAQDEAHQTMNALWQCLAGQPTDQIEAALRVMPVTVPGHEAVPAADALGELSPWFGFQAWNLHRLDPEVLVPVLRGPAEMLDHEDPEELLRRIACPVLLLQADPAAGSSLSDNAVSDMLGLITRATHVQLEGIGHELHGDPRHVPAVVQAIKQFLDH